MKMALIVAGLALVLAGCGRRGPLEAPPDTAAPKAEESAAPDGLTGVPTPGARRRAGPIVPPKDPFILDPLL